MCFSAKSSIIAFFVGVIGSILCISLGEINDKIVGYLFLFVAFMQGIEYLLWNHRKCDMYNRIISVLGMILNHLQPIVLGIIILLINPYLTPAKVFWIKIFIFIYIFVIIPYSFKYISNKDIQCTIKRGKHLYWKWTNMKYYIFIYSLFLFTFCLFAILGMKNLTYGISFAFIGLFSYITSYIFYSKSTGALWCYYAVFIPIIYYFLRRLKIIHI